MKTRVYKPSYTHNGERKYSSNYLIQFYDHLGVKRRLASGFDREKQAQHFAGKITELVSFRSVNKTPSPELIRWVKKDMPPKMKDTLLKWGVLADEIFAEKQKRTLAEYLELYRQKLRVGFRPKLQKMLNGDSRVNSACNQNKRIIDGCGFKVWADIRFDTVGDFIRTLDISSRTFNYYVRDFEQFCRFVIDSDFEHTLPKGGKIPRFAVEDRPVRRALSPDEVSTLIEATASAPEAFGMSGHERAVMYLTASETGYRSIELKRLTVADFDLQHGSINLDNTKTKNRRYAEQPIRKRRILQYRFFFTGKQPTDRAFNFWINPRSAEMIRKDLKAAGVKVKNSKGIPADFHSLRKTFCTQLDNPALGLTETEKDKLSRHSNKGNLRRDRYTDVSEERIRKAIELLPDYGWPKTEEERNSGRNESHDSIQKVG